jgi:hypothetical protein
LQGSSVTAVAMVEGGGLEHEKQHSRGLKRVPKVTTVIKLHATASGHGNR